MFFVKSPPPQLSLCSRNSFEKTPVALEQVRGSNHHLWLNRANRVLLNPLMMFQTKTEKSQEDQRTEGRTSETKTDQSSVQTQQTDKRMKSEKVVAEEGKKSDEDEDLTSL